MKKMCILIYFVVLISSLIALSACDEDSTNVSIPVLDYSNVENEEIHIEQETEPNMMGWWTLDKVKKCLDYDFPRFFVRYPDGSFDQIDPGSVMNWGSAEAYTYGSERNCFNLIMGISDDNKNMSKLEKGELVFVSSQNSRVDAYIYPVIESGYAMTGIDPEERINSILWKTEDGSSFDYVNFNRNRKERKISTINGINVGEEGIFEKSEKNKYVTLKEGDKYIVGEVWGTQLFENTYCVDKVYYLHTYHTYYQLYEYRETMYAFNLQPTTDGYALVDLSELPTGDYVVMYTYWNEKDEQRDALTIHIQVS